MLYEVITHLEQKAGPLAGGRIDLEQAAKAFQRRLDHVHADAAPRYFGHGVAGRKTGLTA